ncbi:hypothetical protein N0V90_000392 [Kalmusia sp. IMI 367209]|nr:hypothetical protein N0V90_000392 [Kalmusia sp. IMI 367209]
MSVEQYYVWTLAPSLLLRSKLAFVKKSNEESRQDVDNDSNIQRVHDPRALWDRQWPQLRTYHGLPDSLKLPPRLVAMWRICDARVSYGDLAPKTPELRHGRLPFESKLDEFLEERRRLDNPSKLLFSHVVVLKILSHMLDFKQACAPPEGSDQPREILRVIDMTQRPVEPKEAFPWFRDMPFTDYALGIKHLHRVPTRQGYPESQSFDGYIPSISNFLSVCVHDTKDKRLENEHVRMFDWALAEFQKRYRRPGSLLKVPHLSIEVRADTWLLWCHIGQLRSEDRDARQPQALVLGSTKDSYSLLVLIANLADTVSWGVSDNGYRSWLEQEVLRDGIHGDEYPC